MNTADPTDHQLVPALLTWRHEGWGGMIYKCDKAAADLYVYEQLNNTCYNLDPLPLSA